MGPITSINDSFAKLKVYWEKKFTRFNERLTGLNEKVTGLNEKVTDLNEKVIDLDCKFAKQNSQLINLQNMILNEYGENIVAVPFLDGTSPQDHGLPEIKTVSDIDRLSKEECYEFLTGYGVSFSDSEEINLKRKLRDAIGFTLGKDVKYSFHNFDTE